MLSSSFKMSHNHSYQTPALSYIHFNEINDSKFKNLQSKRDSEMSILQKLNLNKFKNIQDINISRKIILRQEPYESKPKYFVLGDAQVGESQKMKNHNQPYKYSQVQDKLLTFSPLALKQHKISSSSANLINSHAVKQNTLNKTPSRQRFLNPTESWTQKISSEKSPQKIKTLKHKKSMKQREPFAPLTIHEQLYLQSRKKQLKRSTEQIIENEYFKKVHPFKPKVGQVSEFLAEQKRTKIKKRQNFEKEFQEFQSWQQEKSLKKQKTIETKKVQKDKFDIEKEKQAQQKQTELKNYTILKQFFYYLTENQSTLTYSNLTPKRLCELPSPCIKFLQPILQEFYKNKSSKKLQWHEFLSEFNMKVSKRKSFYSLLEKWFWVKFKLSFDKNCKESFHGDNNNNTKFENELDSTHIGHETTIGDNGSRAKLMRNYRQNQF